MKKRVMMLALLIAAGISGNTMKAQSYMSDEEQTKPRTGSALMWASASDVPCHTTAWDSCLNWVCSFMALPSCTVTPATLMTC